MDHEQVVCSIFGERDIGAVSKSRLVLAVSKQNKLIRDLVTELFCENPYNNFFRQYTEGEVSPLRVERIRRFSEGMVNKGDLIKHEKASGRNENTKRL